jgi:cytochrome P450
MKTLIPQAIHNLTQFMRNPLLFTEEMHEKHGDFFLLHLGHKKFYFAYHPDHAEKILGHNADRYIKSRLIFDKIRPITGMRGLVQLEGAEWSEIRKITNEIIQKPAINEYLPILNHYLDELEITLDDHAKHQAEFDISSLMISYTIKSMARIVFGVECDHNVEQIAKEFIELNRLCGIKMRSIISLPLSIPTPLNRKINKTRRWLTKAVEDLIRKKQKNANQTSLLSVLLKKLPKDYHRYSEMIHDQVMTFLFAGYETTAASLAFCFYLLANNKNCQKNIFSETNNSLTSLADIKKLSYTAAVYKEALRLFPPAWILAREVVSKDTIAGHQLSIGDNVILCTKEIHRHKDFWPDQDNFMPERFLSRDNRLHKFDFIPFGMGQRICSGNQLAMVESVNLLARLCKHYEFSIAENFTIETEAMVTLHPKNGIMLKVKRNDRT